MGKTSFTPRVADYAIESDAIWCYLPLRLRVVNILGLKTGVRILTVPGTPTVVLVHGIYSEHLRIDKSKPATLYICRI